MELLKHINERSRTYSIANLLCSRTIVEVCSREELYALLYTVKCSSLVNTNMDEYIWDRYSKQERYKGSMGIYFNYNSLEFCYMDYYRESIYHYKNPMYKYSDIIVVSV